MTDSPRLPDVTSDLLGEEWADESVERVIVELAFHYADPAEVKLQLDTAMRKREGRYSEDDTVNEIIREVLQRQTDSVGLQTFQGVVRSVAGVRQPATVKQYVRDAVRDGPFRPDPGSINRFLIEDHAPEATATEVEP